MAADESPSAVFERPSVDDHAFGGDRCSSTLRHFVGGRLALLADPGFHDSCRSKVDFAGDAEVEPVPRDAATGVDPLLLSPGAIRHGKNPDHAVADGGFDEIAVVVQNGILQALQLVERVPRLLVVHRARIADHDFAELARCRTQDVGLSCSLDGGKTSAHAADGEVLSRGCAFVGVAPAPVRGRLTWMDAEQQVIRAAEARASALAEGDAERLFDLLHEDFRWTAHVGETYSRQEYVRRNTEGHTRWRSQELRNPEVVIVGETAVVYAEVTDVVLSGDESSETFRMPMTQVWVHLGGDWKCLAGHAGPRLT